MIAVNGIEEAIFEVANALRVPVLMAALLALAFLLFDLGAFLTEIARRARRRGIGVVEQASTNARQALALRDEQAASRALMI